MASLLHRREIVRLAALGLVCWGAFGCLAEGTQDLRPVEREAPPVLGGEPSDLQTVVALYTTKNIVTTTGTFEVVTGVGSGTLVCPTAVLTALHVVEDGPLHVSNASPIFDEREALVRDRATGAVRRTTLRIPREPQAVQSGEALRLTIDGTTDGLAMIPLDHAYPSELPFPSPHASIVWRSNPFSPREGRLFGYGVNVVTGFRRGTGSGVRRTARLKLASRATIVNEVAQPRTPFLFWGWDARESPFLQFTRASIYGDSGGPVFGPLDESEGELWGVVSAGMATSDGQTVSSLVIDLAPHLWWFQQSKEALCGFRTAWTPPDPAALAEGHDVAAFPPEDVVQTFALAEDEPLDDAEVCLCAVDCQAECGWLLGP